jgi:hypothetical protein
MRVPLPKLVDGKLGQGRSARLADPRQVGLPFSWFFRCLSMLCFSRKVLPPPHLSYVTLQKQHVEINTNIRLDRSWWYFIRMYRQLSMFLRFFHRVKKKSWIEMLFNFYKVKYIQFFFWQLCVRKLLNANHLPWKACLSAFWSVTAPWNDVLITVDGH